MRRPESADAAVLQLPEAGNAIAVSIDGNGRRVACDPYAGTIEAVLECAQNLACVGAEPLGLTNCLNFGNPEKPAAAWQLDRAVSGLADACEALGVPVVGGNVSLYNEGPEGPIYPTPVVGMVGELPDPARVAGSAFAARGRRDRACSAPSPPPSPARSWPSSAASSTTGLPQPDIAAVAAACATVRDAVRAGRLASAHDVSDGGLACALAESRDRRRARLPGRPRSPCASAAARPRRPSSARAAAASWSAASAATLEALGATLLGEVGGTTIEIAAGDRSLAVGLGTRRERLALAAGAGRARRRLRPARRRRRTGRRRRRRRGPPQRGRFADDRDQDRGAEHGADLAEGGVDGAGGGEAVVGDVADGGGAEGREGEADADPGQAGARQPEAELVGLGAGRAQDHHAGREEEGAGDDHGAVAEAVGELAGRAGDDGRERRARAASPAPALEDACSPRSR